MKRRNIIAAVILTVASAAVTFALSCAVLGLFFAVLSLGWLLGLLIAVAEVTGLYFIGKLFLKKGFIKKRVLLWFLSTGISLILSGIAFIAVFILDDIGYFTGLFAGLGEFVIALCWLIYSAIVTAGFGIVQGTVAANE